MRGELDDPCPFRDAVRVQPENITSDSGRSDARGIMRLVKPRSESRQISKLLESLILAQDERWRRA